LSGSHPKAPGFAGGYLLCDGGHLVQLMVGQAEEMSDGRWWVEVNDGVMFAR